MKKLFSIFISAIIMLSSYQISMAEEIQNEISYNARAYNDAQLLMNSIADTQLFNGAPESIITRAQYVSMVTRIFKISNYLTGNQVYSDVQSDNDYFREIINAYYAGWISNSDTFRPDDGITQSEGVKIILCAAGYDKIADANGGYPSGYTIMANTVSLLKNISKTNSDLLTVADTYIMLYNIMHAESIKITPDGDYLNYEKSSQTYIEKLYDIQVINGVITSTPYNSIVMNATFIKDSHEMTINGVAYSCQNISRDMLGMNVIAYVADKGIKGEEVICTIQKNNNEISIIADDFEKIENSILYYNDNGNQRKVSLDGAYKVIYNGRRVSKMEDYMLSDCGASIRMLSNDNDNTYDIVFIDAYSYGYVTSVDYVNGYIGIKTPNSKIDLSKDDTYSISIHSGDMSDIELYELKRDVVVAIKISDDGILYDITICSNSVSGKITKLQSDEHIIFIDNNRYRMSDSFENDISACKIGAEISCTIGIHGELAYLNSNGNDMAYGYLNNIYFNDSDEVDVNLKIFTMAGKLKRFSLAERVLIDNESSKYKKDKAYEYINANFEKQIIRYGVNSEGEINRIDFASHDTSNFEKKQNPNDNLIMYHSLSDGSLRYRGACKGFNSKALLGNASILIIPKKESDRDDEDNYTVSDYTSLISDTLYECEIFNVDEYGMADLAIVYVDVDDDPSEYTYTSYMVENVSKTIIEHDNGIDEGYNLYCWGNNQYQTFFLPDYVQINKTSGSFVSPGDIVRFKMVDGIIKKIYVDYDYSSGSMVFDSNGGASLTNTCETNLGFTSGKVYSMNDQSAVISDTKDDSGIFSFNYVDLMPYAINKVMAVFDTKTKKIRPITSDNVNTYLGYGNDADYVIIRQRYTQTACIFVIR